MDNACRRTHDLMMLTYRFKDVSPPDIIPHPDSTALQDCFDISGESKVWFRECSTELSTRYCFLRSSTNRCLTRASRRRNLFLLPCICSAQRQADARRSVSLDDLRGLVGHQRLCNACVRLRTAAQHVVSTRIMAMTTTTV